MTLVELMVAATVTGVLLSLAAPAWRTVVYETKLVERRATALSELQVARAFLVGDLAIAEGPLGCGGGDVASLSLGTADGVPAVAEYRLRDGGLYRWSWPPGDEILVARGIEALICSSTSDDQLTLGLVAGKEPYSVRLDVRLVSLPPSPPPAQEEP
jgi:hypothetical protein